MRVAILIIFLLFSVRLMAKEELTQILGVSTTGRTFASGHGAQDGIVEGQKVIFSNKEISIRVTAKAVSRFYTVWELDSQSGGTPFKKDEFVIFNSAPEDIWFSLQKSKSIYATVKKTSTSNSGIILRGSVNRSLSESVSSTTSDGEYVRSGTSGELLYQRTLSNVFDLAVGGRMDKDNTTAGALVIPSTKYYLLGEVTYNLPDFGRTYDKNYYITIGTGFGNSTSDIAGEIVSGSSRILPYLRLGFMNQYSKKYHYFLEVQSESVATTEKFESGETQSTTTINAKISIGLRLAL